jgi:hypothetical protein
MAWLKYELEVPDVRHPAAHGDPALMAVARPLGAASDLLAVQDAVTASVLDDRVSLVGARAAVAAIASLAARSALDAMTSVSRRRRTVEQRSLATHLRIARKELEPIAAQVSNSQHLGALGGLATGMPATSGEVYAQIARAAAHWQRLHEEIPAQSLLTRDLRSITAQIRTAAGHGRYLVRAVGASAQRLGFGGAAVMRLRKANTALRRSDTGSIRTTAAWNRHLSDLGGTTSLPGEFAFRELHEAVRRTVVQPDGALRPIAELIPDRWTADAVLGAVDEIVHSAHQVAAMQQRAVFDLVIAGRLFVSRSQAIRVDPTYQQLTVAPVGKPQRNWVRAERIDFVAELTEPIAATTELLSQAALVCRQLAHTEVQRRPTRLESPTRIAGPDPKRRPRKAVAQRPDQPGPSPAVELP